jgi:hypothetical protein
VFFRHHVYRSEEVYLLVGDEVVVTKLIVPHCWMSPKFLKLLKRRHENAL